MKTREIESSGKLVFLFCQTIATRYKFCEKLKNENRMENRFT